MKWLKLGIHIVAAIAIFGYGVAVGSHEWPPFSLLKSLAYRAILDDRRAEAFREARTSIFRTSAATADIIMVGDSLTEYGPWAEYFSEYHIINRGIASETSLGLLHRLSEILNRQPKSVFIMIGVNDLRNGAEPNQVADRVQAIVNTFRQHQIKVIVQSVLPVRADYVPAINSKVVQLNRELARMGDYYIDVAHYVTEQGGLSPRLTFDGLHLNGDGYALWRTAIASYIP
jgi:hypothetical protein